MIVVACISFPARFKAEVKNTQLGRLVDHEKLPAYRADQDYSKKKYFSVVRILDMETEKGFCSGFVISDSYAVSAAHCFIDDDSALKDVEYLVATEIITNKDTALQESLKIVAKVVGVKVNADYALLTGDFSEITKIRIDVTPFVLDKIVSREILPGMIAPLYALGYPNGIAQGAGYEQTNCTPVYDYVTCSGVIYHGLSGGPLVDPLTGTVYGVNYAIGKQARTFFKLLMGIFESFNIKVE